ncbi:MFS transporter [Gordonia neofelifaecis]|uniref:Major facilitator superfamily multidrug resistance protein n=1 Tax=Gordonia neofelifaecis NRRL B-59395 TaxID=644548 RepID=F1YK83_9ACTN|nr:MFS transporter [Gordonia neofelifaecis]EGD54929.1 major facilitator superfamily multidrug resistance protein [Gordonia neofelifaecis NRRL B-59395]
MTEHRRLTPALIYAALTTSVVSSLGMLLVPSISAEMGVGVGAAQWMLTINLMVGAVATPIMGRLGDGPHTRRLLLVSLSVILAGSVIAAAAPVFPVFLIGRALQGLSYGIVPVTIVLARRHLSTVEVDPAISSLSVTVATGLGIGYPLTGVIASLADFRAAFWFAAVFVATAIAVVWRLVPESEPRRTGPAFDVVGATLLSIGLAALLTAVSQGPNWGWFSPPTLGTAFLAVCALVAWTAVELRSSHPLINLHVLRQSDVLLANATAIGLGATLYMSLSTASIIAQAPSTTGYGIGLPLFWAGFVMLPLSIGSLAGNRFVRRLGPNSTTAMLPAGATLMAVAAVMLAVTSDQLWEILLGMALFGLGMGAAYAAMPTLIARNVAISEVGSAVSFNQVLRTVGGALGSAVVGAVLAAHPGATGIDVALAVAAVGGTLVWLGLVVNHLRVRRRTASH